MNVTPPTFATMMVKMGDDGLVSGACHSTATLKAYRRSLHCSWYQFVSCILIMSTTTDFGEDGTLFFADWVASTLTHLQRSLRDCSLSPLILAHS